MELILDAFGGVEGLLATLIGIAVFASVVGIAMPHLETDPLQGRMKAVASERERIRDAQRRQMDQQMNQRQSGAGRLRAPKKKLVVELVEQFNLRELLETPGTRLMLKQAGMRSEGHLYTFLLAKVAIPLIASVMGLFYVSQVVGDDGLSTPATLGIVGAALAVGFQMPNIAVNNIITKRQASMQRSWPNALDLLLICVESGMSVEVSLLRVAQEIGTESVPLAEELSLTNAELSYLQDRKQAFDNLGKRTGVKPIQTTTLALIQAERYGVALSDTLRVMAQENRDLRLAEAEKKAAALGPKLTIPTVLFFLPIIFIVVMAPVVFKAIDTFYD